MDEYKKWVIDFGVRLRAERDRQGLTRVALANLIGTKHNHIAQLERGDKAPSMRALLGLLSALNVSPEFLLSDPNIKGDDMDNLLRNISGFLKGQDVKVVSALYEIMRFMAEYLQTSDSTAE
jgi:transcriptional regulator with XRE-family HTH domain